MYLLQPVHLAVRLDSVVQLCKCLRTYTSTQNA